MNLIEIVVAWISYHVQLSVVCNNPYIITSRSHSLPKHSYIGAFESTWFKFDPSNRRTSTRNNFWKVFFSMSRLAGSHPVQFLLAWSESRRCTHIWMVTCPTAKLSDEDEVFSKQIVKSIFLIAPNYLWRRKTHPQYSFNTSYSTAFNTFIVAADRAFSKDRRTP